MTEQTVIVGAGQAASTLYTNLIKRGYAGHITLIGDEPFHPYQRPPLSKKYLCGELIVERLLVRPPHHYDNEQTTIMLNNRVKSVDVEQHRVVLHDQQSIEWDKLVFATGSRSRKISFHGDTLAHIYYLRSINDVDQIRAQMGKARKMLIVGAGYIGLEVAAAAAHSGIEVTVLELQSRIMSRVVAPVVSEFYQQQHEQHGVKFLTEHSVAEFRGEQAIRQVVLDTGECLEADLVLIGVGAIPNQEVAQDAGIACSNGIRVNAYCETSSDAVFAAGDCTNHPSRIYAKDVRLESVHNAMEQAKTVAATLCGERIAYDQTPWFWSDQYDLKLQIAGLSQGHDQLLMRGDPKNKKFALFYLKDKVLIAVDAVNSAKEFLPCKTLIAQQARIDPEDLASPDVDLKQFINA